MCAQGIRDAVHEADLRVRAGIHTGGGAARRRRASIAVRIAARVAKVADADEVLVSRTVVGLVAGSELRFDDRGSHDLKGVPGTWQLRAVR
jgi:class 3 adenylate cyclase